MPRISPALIRQANSIHPYLGDLLPVCRDLRSAQNELRWLKEHACKLCSAESPAQARLLRSYVRRRARAEPLQYILGSEYFGDLEIECRRDVLIPRPETAASITHLVNRLAKAHEINRSLSVLDLCTGTGCIPLLFHHEFYSKPSNQLVNLAITAVDIADASVELAQRNVRKQLQLQTIDGVDCEAKMVALRNIRLLKADVLQKNSSCERDAVPGIFDALKHGLHGTVPVKVDVLISNPPYISAKAFKTTTARSVRNFEPRLALVPGQTHAAGLQHDGDVFYPRLIHHAERLHAQLVLFEVADMEQATRVASMVVAAGGWQSVEIWRDEPAVQSARMGHIAVGKVEVKVIGTGHARSVFAYGQEAARWLVD